MVLRARLTAAFLVVVLGPVLLSGVFVGGTVASVNRSRINERLDMAVAATRTALAALCHQLLGAAQTAAVLTDGGSRPQVAQQVVDRALAGVVQFEDATGKTVARTSDAPAQPWADCARPVAGATVTAIAAQVEMRDRDGVLLGYIRAAQTVDPAMVRRLAQASGAAVTVLNGAGPSGVLSTESASVAAAVTTLAARRANGTTDDGSGRYVRRLDAAPGEPLVLAISVGRADPHDLYPLLFATVVLAGLFAVGAAWWLARSTTRPLAELAHAVDRVAAGDFAARVPVRSGDEVGQLAGTFNRMTREMRSYVQALTASRDQLRGNLAVVGDTLSSTHDLQRILRVILHTAVAATGAQAGVVLLADPRTGELVGQCGEGLSSDAGELRIPPGAGLLGAVAVSGYPLRGRADRDGPALSRHEPACRTYVAVPFCAPSPIGGAVEETGHRGVLALYDRLGNDEFDDTDTVTLRTFAGQAAIAVRNVLAHQEIERLSLTDSLTGLWNHRHLHEALRREVERANRFGRTLCVLALDLDWFKEVNDTYGHAAGDEVLTEFARRIGAETREVDLAFRHGGEEFVVLLPETDARGGAIVAQRLGAAIRDVPVELPHFVRAAVTSSGFSSGAAGHLSVVTPVRVPLTVSIGVAVYPEHGVSGRTVLAAADEALYAAKAAGRDTYRVSDRVPTPEPATAEYGSDGGLVGSGGTTSGASSGPQPPRQSRGR